MKISNKWLIVLLVCCLSTITSYSHSSWQQHAEDMRGVFGFEEDSRLDGWMKFISSDMIDQTGTFYSRLKRNHPGFSCKHRLLFHWGYDTEPWSLLLERRVRNYCEDYNLNVESNIRIFKSEMKGEQRKRNSLINKKTESLFGFAHGGKDGSYARFFAALAYDTHLIGDYMSDNTDLDGLQDFNRLISHVITVLRSLDNIEFKKSGIQRQISLINRKYAQNQEDKADYLMAYLKSTVPIYIRKAQGGSIYRRLNKRGFKFRESEKKWYKRILSQS